MIATILLVVNYSVVAAFFLLRTRKRSFNLLDPAWAFLAGYFLNYCFRPTLFLIYPEVALWYEDTLQPAGAFRAALPGVLVFALFGLLGFIIGDLCLGRIALGVSRHLPEPDLKRPARCAPYSLIAALFLGAGIAGLWGFIRLEGWGGTLIAFLTGELRNVFNVDILGHGYYTFAMQLSLVGWGLICLKWFGIPKTRHGFRRFSHALVCVVWFLATLLLWMAVGERSSIINVLFIPFALWLALGNASGTAHSRETHMRKATAFVVLFAILIVTIAGPIGLIFRGREGEVASAAVISMATSAWDAMEFTAVANQDLRFRDLLWGRSYVGDIIYTWYPRAIFPTKPERYGILTVQDLFAPSLAASTGATFPPGILVEAYANFWYAGLFFVPLLLAVICRAVYFKVQANSFFWLVLTALLYSQVASFRGLGSVLAFLVANFCVVGAVVVICRLARFFAVSSEAIGYSTSRKVEGTAL